MKKYAVLIAALVWAGALGAQYPGQMPPAGYPPGQYPPNGQYPPGEYPPGYPGGGISIPHRGKKGQKKSEIAQPALAADGRTLSNDGKKLVIATNDGRTITMTLLPETKFTRSGNDISPSLVIPRTTVHIEAAEDDEAFLTAIHVDLLKDAPAEARIEGHRQPATSATPAAATDDDTVRPTILGNPPDDPQRPILRRGKPKSVDSENDDSDHDIPVAANKPAPKPAASSGDFTIDGAAEPPGMARVHDELIDQTKQWSMTFTNGLPNYVCQQDTTRYMEESRSAGWQALDIVTAKVIYEDGKEQYKEITVGGKRTNKSMLELGGSTSTGEFASTLHSLFSDASQAQFKFYQSTHLRDDAAAIYDFKIALPNSDWFITVGGQTLRPAYSGSVWILKDGGHVRRLEMQADNIPKDFPLDSIQWAVDYDEVSLGSAKFLLPVSAENLSCRRGSTICTKNTTEFRDYHKYAGQSTIVFK